MRSRVLDRLRGGGGRGVADDVTDGSTTTGVPVEDSTEDPADDAIGEPAEDAIRDSAEDATGEPSVECPARSLMGEPLPIRIAGAPAGPVEVRVTATDDLGRRCRARTTVRPDGEATTITLASATGSAVPGMALWALRPDASLGVDLPLRPGPVLRRLVRVLPRSIRPGFGPEHFVAGDRASVELQVAARAVGGAGSSGEWTDAGTTTRLLHDRSIGRRPVREPVVGRVYATPEGGPSPGVVFLHGSNGLPHDAFCRQLASHGYAVLALQYFAADVPELPSSLRRVPLEYFEQALSWFGSHDAVGDDLALVGVSRGGEAAMLVGAAVGFEGPVISYAGSGIVHPGFPEMDEPAWTRDGRPLVRPAAFYDLASRYDGGGDLFFDGIDPAEPPAIDPPLAVPVEEIDGPVLAVSAAADSVWRSSELYAVAERRLERFDHPHRFEHRTFPGADHYVLTPYQRLRGVPGGLTEGTARAAIEAWPATLSYLP